jgi:hypothetical protein
MIVLTTRIIIVTYSRHSISKIIFVVGSRIALYNENGWICPLVEQALDRAGMFNMSTYVDR